MDSCSPACQKGILHSSNYGGRDKHVNPLVTLWGRKVYIESYGCTFNLADSQLLKTILRQNGCTIVGEEEADSVIVNTCTVVARTERHVLNRLREFSTKDLYVMGCMPVVQMEQIASVVLQSYTIEPSSRLCWNPWHHPIRGNWSCPGCNGMSWQMYLLHYPSSTGSIKKYFLHCYHISCAITC
jgi:hypothetical protein